MQTTQTDYLVTMVRHDKSHAVIEKLEKYQMSESNMRAKQSYFYSNMINKALDYFQAEPIPENEILAYTNIKNEPIYAGQLYYAVIAGKYIVPTIANSKEFFIGSNAKRYLTKEDAAKYLNLTKNS